MRAILLLSSPAASRGIDTGFLRKTSILAFLGALIASFAITIAYFPYHSAEAIFYFFLVYALYVFGHVCRAVRLAFLSNRVARVRDIVWTQMAANGVSIILPFRLGEIARLFLLRRHFSSLYRTAILVVGERLFDFAVVFSAYLLLYNLVADKVIFDSRIYQLGFAVLLGIAAAVLLVPKMSQFLLRYLVVNYRGRRVIGLIKVVKWVDMFLQQVIGALRSRIAPMTVLSLLIWSAEIGVLFILGGGTSPERLADSFHFLLSATFGATWLNEIGAVLLGVSGATISGLTTIYLIVALIPALVFSVFALIRMKVWKFRSTTKSSSILMAR